MRDESPSVHAGRQNLGDPFPSTPTTVRRIQPLVMALAAMLGTLGAAEITARWIRSRDPVAHSYEAPRNPRFRRDWVRYTAPRPRPEGSRLVIAIANSQGFLREEADGTLTWPSRLADRLNSDGAETIVANWAVPAGSSSEMILLAARAAAHGPDLVIVSAGGNSFSNPFAFEKPLSFWLSDTTTLSYLPSVRRLLTPEFLDRTAARDPSQALRAWSALAWFRARHLDPNRDTWDWVLKKYRRVRRLRIRDPSPEAVRVQLLEMVQALHRQSPETRLLITQMPLAPGALAADAQHRARTTTRVATALFADHATIRVVSALDLLPDEFFHTATHMDRRGHARYAEWLEPHVRHLLDG